jgi:very-short-patch-repair endonuclease
LIIECDSEAHHGGWDARRRDLRRDQEAAALGYHTFRPIAEDIFWHPERVVAALRGLLRIR